MPSSADLRKRACHAVVRAQDRAAAEAESRHPTDFKRAMDLERLLYDRYELPIFRQYGIPPARNGELVAECARKRG